MRLVSRLRRIMAMMIVLLGLLAGLGIASAQDDAPVPSGGGGLQTPRVAEGASATLPSSATGTPLSSPSPIQAATPLSPTPSTPSSMTGCWAWGLMAWRLVSARARKGECLLRCWGEWRRPLQLHEGFEDPLPRRGQERRLGRMRYPSLPAGPAGRSSSP